MSLKKFLCRLLSCCEKQQNPGEKWWLLTRPDGAGVGERGIILYNETNTTIEATLPIPAGLTSPHALDFDGKSLWVGGMGDNESLYELDPANGNVLSEISNKRTEGIALVEEGIWYSGRRNVNLIGFDGTQKASVSVDPSVTTIQDIAVSGFCSLCYVVNGAMDPIIEIDMLNSNEHTLFDTQVSKLYTLTVKDANFVVIGTSNNIIRFNRSGVVVGDHPTSIKGWITAIAPYKQ